MPTYEYHCKKCGHSFEVQHSISAAPLTQCPKDICPKKAWGKGAVQRGPGGGAGLLFKGSGFYITDYRSKNYSAAKSKDSSGASSSPPAPSSSSKPSSGSGNGAKS